MSSNKFKALSLYFFITLSIKANVIGTDFQLFNPTHDVDHYITVYSSRTLAKGQLNFGMFLDAAMNTLPDDVSTTETKNIRTSYKDLIVQNDIHLAYGIMRGWDVGVSTPVVFQTLKEDKSKVIFDTQGMTEYRLSTKVRVMGTGTSGLALVGILSQNLIKNNPYMGDANNLNYQIIAVANSNLFKKIDGTINLGYRKRDPGKPITVIVNNSTQNFPIEPTDDQFTASIGVGYDVNRNWRYIYEVYGASNLDKTIMQTYRKQTSIENLIGVRYRPSKEIFYYVGAATELNHGVGTADFRAFAGVNWTPQLFYRKSTLAVPPPVEPESSEYMSNDEETIITQQQEVDSMTEQPVVVADVDLPAPTPTEIPDEKFTVNNIYFDLDSDRRILRSSRRELAKVGEYLKKRGFTRLVIEGHTDSQGDANYNLELSKRRAQSIKELLVQSYGFSPTSIFIEGFGLTKPVADNATEEGRKKNRRVEFKIFND